MKNICSAFSFFTEDVLNSLRKGGIFTVNNFLRTENKQIERISFLTFPEICEVKRYIAKSFSATPLNAFKYYQKTLSHSALITTGLKELDELLQGGLLTGTIYEFCGPPSSGKSFIISTIIAKVLSENNIYFLDTKYEFSGKYMKKLLDQLGQKEHSLQLMKKILVRHIFTKYDIISTLHDIKRDLENGTPIRIIIIHSLPTLFLKTSDKTENNHIFNQLANILRYIAHKHYVVIIITNLITFWTKQDNSKDILEKTACGKYWQSVPNVRLKVNRQDENAYEITVLKHSNLRVNTSCSIKLNVK